MRDLRTELLHSGANSGYPRWILFGEKLLNSSFSASGTLPQCGYQCFLLPYAFSVVLLLSVLPTPAFAVDAVWLTNAPSGVWNLGTNWSNGIAPVNPGDTAAFNTSTQTSPTINAPVTINSITFNPGASVFSIQVAPFVPLTLQGVGIVNLTPTTQTIINGGPASITAFTTGATAGNATIFNSGANSFTLFTAGATAGSATINNTGVLNLTSFMAGATAGSATINNTGALSLTSFEGATAGNATINNSGTSSLTSFTTGASAANATINSSGASSFTLFNTGATAGNATITNSGGGSFTAFIGGASGGNAALINANPTALITTAELSGQGTTVGSIAGSGNLFLGSKNLTVGDNQQSTVFTGVISDGESPNLPPSLITPQPSYVGGSLTKVGAGR